MKLTFRLFTSLFFIFAVASIGSAQNSAPKTLMCIPGETVLSEDFSPETISERWWYKGDFALRDGALVRTNLHPTENRRVFFKDPSFHNTVVQFDFKLAGKTTDLRLVTGSGGGYNSVTQIRTDHFQINTPVDRDAGIVPAHLGECVRESHQNQWQTMTVEYWNNEIVAHLNENEFVLGKHPIIDRTRTYFAFQFDFPGASIDNVRVWKATGQKNRWSERRKGLLQVQSDRAAVQRDPVERYKYEHTNVISRLTLNDQTYRELVAKHENLKSELHAAYPEAFASHKELGKQIAKRKKHIKQTEPDFKPMEVAIHRSRRAEDDYVLSTKPELEKLNRKGLPKQRFNSELAQVRAQLESNSDKKLAALVAETARLQAALENRFPEAFESVDAAVEKRNAVRKSLNSDSQFQSQNRLVVDANNALKEYVLKAAPELAELSARAAAYQKDLKPSKSK